MMSSWGHAVACEVEGHAFLIDAQLWEATHQTCHPEAEAALAAVVEGPAFLSPMNPSVSFVSSVVNPFFASSR